MKDKYILIFMIVNIILFSFLMAFLTNKKAEPKKKEVEDIIISKSCVLNVPTDDKDVSNTQSLTINYFKNSKKVNDYEITYDLSYNSKKEPKVYAKYKNEYDNIINESQNNENINFTNYYFDDKRISFKLIYNLRNINGGTLINYNDDILNVISQLTVDGYVCE